MSNRFAMNVALWLSAVLFFVGIMMSFGTLHPTSIVDKDKFFQLRMTLPMIGFGLLPMVSLFYSNDFESYVKKIGIEFEKPSSEILLISVFLVFFFTLCYVAAVCLMRN